MSVASLRQVLTEPGKALKIGLALLRGHWYKLYYPMRGIRFSAGRNFRVFGGLSVRGPGQVIFGDNVTIFRHTTPWTMSPEARISVGNNVMMSAPRFGCVKEVRIGDNCILAEIRITDSDFHSTRADRRSEDAPIRVAPVIVEDNVWVGELAALLAGTRIGRNSVVSFGAICVREYPENVIIMGNPAKVAAPIPPLPAPMEGSAEPADPARLRTSFDPALHAGIGQ